MFSKKLEYYEKPCKWLKFVLNIYWPLLFLNYGWYIVKGLVSWGDVDPVCFGISIVAVVSILAADLLTRFLDKTGMIAAISGESVVALVELAWCIRAYIVFKAASSAMQFENSGVGIADAFLNIMSGATNIALGAAFAGRVCAFIVQLAVSISTIIYISRRSDLFLTSEKQLKREFEFEE